MATNTEARVPATKKISDRVLTIVVLACITLASILTCAWLYWQLGGSRLDAIPAGTGTEAAQPTGRQQTDLEALLPPGSTILETLQADVDNDGRRETLVAFNLPDEPGGLLVVDAEIGRERETWTVQPTTEGKVADLELADVNADHDFEILIHKATEDDKWHYLHIYDWDGTSLVGLDPHGGPLDDMDGFQSACLPPELRDVDMDGGLELMVYQDQSAHDRLSVLVYTWTGGMFAYEDALYVVGPVRPAHCGETLQ
jgi:hypothetical protein